MKQRLLKRQAVQRKRNEKVSAYSAFNSNNGRQVLKDLERVFYDIDLTSDDEHSSSVKVGGHRVILYIKRMIAAGEK